MNDNSRRKCAEFSSEEMRPYKREFQYQGCKLLSLLNSMGYQTINIHICSYIFYLQIILADITIYCKSLHFCEHYGRTSFKFLCVMVLTYFIDTQTSKELIQMDVMCDIHCHKPTYICISFCSLSCFLLEKYDV